MARRTAKKGTLGRSNEPPVLILTSLAAGPKHGYALTKDIEEFAGVALGPGTLYGSLARLEERGLIAPEPLDGSRATPPVPDHRRRPSRVGRDGARDAGARRRGGPPARVEGRCAGPRDDRMSDESFQRVLRWYPPRWRSRYGDEMAALLEDTYASAQEMPRRERMALARSGLAERAREADFVGSTADGAARLRAGTILVLCGWSLFLVAGGAIARFSDNWSAGTPATDRWVASSGYDAVALAGAIGSGLVLVAALIALPGFVRLLRSGRWIEVRGRVASATVAAALTVALLGAAVGWGRHLTASERNGGRPAYGVLFVLVGLSAVVAIACGTAAAVAVARRIEVSGRRLRALGVLALGLTALMALVLAGSLTWWISEALHARGVLRGGLGNGIPFASSSVPPTLLASALLMVLGLLLGVWGSVRVARLLGTDSTAHCG